MKPRILADTPLAAEPTVLAPPSRELDDATRQLLDRERAAAHAAGVEEGFARATEQARRETAVLAAAVRGATAEVVATLAAQHDALATALGERVLAATAAVLGREPDDDGRALVERLVAVVAELDDPQLVVRIAGARAGLVAEALADDAVEVVDDATLGPDEARISGAFVDVDLRVGTLLAALDEVLADHAPLGPVPPGPGGRA